MRFQRQSEWYADYLRFSGDGKPEKEVKMDLEARIREKLGGAVRFGYGYTDDYGYGYRNALEWVLSEIEKDRKSRPVEVGHVRTFDYGGGKVYGHFC